MQPASVTAHAPIDVWKFIPPPPAFFVLRASPPKIIHPFEAQALPVCFSAGAQVPYMVSFRIMASRSVNKVILIGHLGRDAETAYTASQVAVTKFSVATNRRWKDQQTGEWKEETDWSRVVLWRGENVAPYLTKGTQVYVEGRLQTRSYDDKDGKKVWATDVVADQVILLGGRGAGGGSGAGAGGEEGFSQEGYAQPASQGAGQGMRSAPRARPAAAPAAAEPPMQDGISDDDVPF